MSSPAEIVENSPFTVKKIRGDGSLLHKEKKKSCEKEGCFLLMYSMPVL